MRAVTVLRTGPQALVQDRGRPGFAHLGVPPSGAVDLPSLELANRLVGNDPHAAGIEAVLGGVALRATGPCLVAVTGAACRVRVGSREVPFGAAVSLSPGDELRVGTPRRGLRCYLAFAGGVAVEPELGSRSTDLLGGIGPAPLTPGDELPLGDPAVVTRAAVPAGPRTDGAGSASEPSASLVLPVLLGPRDDWFPDAADQLARGEWTVSPNSNRIGVRLEGMALRRAASRHGELPTEPMIIGAIQVPPSGHPVIFLNDHPTTGGYPVIAVVAPAALPALGQARPGTPVRLRP